MLVKFSRPIFKYNFLSEPHSTVLPPTSSSYFGLFRVLELLKKSSSSKKELELLEIGYFWISMLILCVFTTNFGNITTLWAIFWPQFHCNCAETAICALSFKILTTPLNSATPISYIQGYFCDRWSFTIYIKFVTSGISRYSSTRVLDKILDRVLEL